MTGPDAGAEAVYPTFGESLPSCELTAGRYVLRFAQDRADLEAVQRLRFEVFNLELGEGFAESYRTGRDQDELDWHFHHLVITHGRTGPVVGTYRMQTVDMARQAAGFYSAAEFDLDTIPRSVLAESVEIGRACVARDHRNGRVVHLLWRGLAAYLKWNSKRHLFGCCSLTTQDFGVAERAWRHLIDRGYVHDSLAVAPLPEVRCEPVDAEADEPGGGNIIPALFQSYLNLGARVCSRPAIDRCFKTIDFLVTLDTADLDPRVYRAFFRGLPSRRDALASSPS